MMMTGVGDLVLIIVAGFFGIQSKIIRLKVINVWDVYILMTKEKEFPKQKMGKMCV